MELTVDQALQRGIEAHQAGQAQEADRLYTAILKAQPKHRFQSGSKIVQKSTNNGSKSVAK